MIQANELRIKNLLQDEQGIIYEVLLLDCESKITKIRAWGIQNNAFGKSDNQLKPISLTEEWLLKFGFKIYDCEIDYIEYCKEFNKGSYKVMICNDGGINNKYNEPFYYLIEGQENGFIQSFKQIIKSVHQLQNLYFALTGKELTLKNE